MLRKSQPKDSKSLRKSVNAMIVIENATLLKKEFFALEAGNVSRF